MNEGDVIAGKYELGRLIGLGSSGSVYAAKHLQLGSKVAIKLLRSELSNDHEAVERFLREAQAAAGIGSEHIAAVTDIGRTEQGVPYLVMEYLEGKTLARALREQKQMDLARAASMGVQICRALAAAHDKGIVHRDMKPDNVFLVPRDDGTELVKVLDFGIAKVAHPSNPSAANLTAQGTTLGTPYYMAPEQARAQKDIDGRADVYSVGVVLFEAVAGRLPFAGTNFSRILIAATTQDPPPPSLYRADLPPELEAVILKAMAREREDRYATCRELADALEPFTSDTAPPASAPAAASSPPESPVQGPPTARLPQAASSPAPPPAQAAATPAADDGRKKLTTLLIVGAISFVTLLAAAAVGGYVLYQRGVAAGAARSNGQSGGVSPAPPVQVIPVAGASDGDKPPGQADSGAAALPAQPASPSGAPAPAGGADGPIETPFEEPPPVRSEGEILSDAGRHRRSGAWEACLETLRSSPPSPRIVKMRIRCHEGAGHRDDACGLARSCAERSHWCRRFVRDHCR